MDGIDLTLAKLDSALGNVDTSFDSPTWKTPSGSPVSAAVRRDARAATRSGDKLGAVRLLLVAAAEARAAVPAGLLDDVEAQVAEYEGEASGDVRAAIVEALAVLRSPAPEPVKKRRLFGFGRG
jgi:hypothetical protein